jgi:hypothetical protein
MVSPSVLNAVTVEDMAYRVSLILEIETSRHPAQLGGDGDGRKRGSFHLPRYGNSEDSLNNLPYIASLVCGKVCRVIREGVAVPYLV